jgi:alanyl-tRNA synthetase
LCNVIFLSQFTTKKVYSLGQSWLKIVKMDGTMRLYYDDAYTRAFSARVIERDGAAVILDRTYFYPTSGGQPNDTGTIGGTAVLDVSARKEDGAVVHTLAGDIVEDVVECVVNWERRFDHMQHHTGQHILSQAFVQVAGANTVGFHLSPDSVTIDVDQVSIGGETAAEVEALANDIVWGDRPVTARIVQPDDAEGVRIRKLPEHLLTGGLRIIDIDGFDVTACGGTHVARTGEIGIIKILKLEKRGDKTRVEFRCGGRALGDYQQKNAVVNQLAADLTCSIGEIAGAVARLQEDYKAAQRALKAANGQLIEFEAERLAAEATLAKSVRVVKLLFPARDFGDLRVLATSIIQKPGMVALLATGGDKPQLLFARSADVSADMNALLKQTLALLPNGRGGGQTQMAQGGGSGDEAQISAALDSAERSLLEGLQ